MDAKVFEKVDEFFQKYPHRSYPKNQIILFGGEPVKEVFYIASGQICQYDVSYRGDEIILNIFHEPAFFPMSIAINGGDNPYFYKAEADSSLYVAPSQDVVTFLKANPDVLYNLLSRLYRGVDGVLGRVVGLMSGTARSRLIYELIIESRRFGEEAAANVFLLSLHEKDLAARSGLSRETVSRELKKLKDQHLIESQVGQIKINNMNKLENLLGREV